MRVKKKVNDEIWDLFGTQKEEHIKNLQRRYTKKLGAHFSGVLVYKYEKRGLTTRSPFINY